MNKQDAKTDAIIKRLEHFYNMEVDDLGGRSITINNFKGLQKDLEMVINYLKQLDKSDTSKEKSSIYYFNKYKAVKHKMDKLNKIIDKLSYDLADYMLYYESKNPINSETIESKSKELKEYWNKHIDDEEENDVVELLRDSKPVDMKQMMIDELNRRYLKEILEDKLNELKEEFNNYQVDVNCTQDDYYVYSDKYGFVEEKLKELLEENEKVVWKYMN